MLKFLSGKLSALTRLGAGAMFILLAAGASWMGWRLARNQIAGEIYRERLETVTRDYEVLRTHYNEAVRRTAVTELVVQDNRLSVVVRSAAGALRTIETPFDPSREIYVDFVVVGGRLWIRRVFDAQTPPWKGLVIEPEVSDVDWADPRVGVGKAVYRSLDEGRWVVTVTGDGSLGLVRAPDDEPADLQSLPEVREYDEVKKQVRAATEDIGLGDVFREVVGGKKRDR